MTLQLVTDMTLFVSTTHLGEEAQHWCSERNNYSCFCFGIALLEMFKN